MQRGPYWGTGAYGWSYGVVPSGSEGSSVSGAGFFAKRLGTAKGDGWGALTPAICEPSPNFCKVSASSFPDPDSPWACWNRCIALSVSPSHFPLG